MTNEPEPPVEDMAAEAMLKEVIGGWLLEAQLSGTAPMVAASNLFGVLYDQMVDAMGAGAVRMALLMVFERSHEAPMSFIQRQDAKTTLDHISNHRRAVEGKPHLIMPGDA